MKFWLISGLVVGFMVISYLTHRESNKQSYIKHPDLCYDNDDLLSEQEL